MHRYWSSDAGYLANYAAQNTVNIHLPIMNIDQIINGEEEIIFPNYEYLHISKKPLIGKESKMIDI